MYIKNWDKTYSMHTKKCLYNFAFDLITQCIIVNVYEKKIINNKKRLLSLDRFVIPEQILDFIENKKYSFDHISQKHPIEKKEFLFFKKLLMKESGY